MGAATPMSSLQHDGKDKWSQQHSQDKFAETSYVLQQHQHAS